MSGAPFRSHLMQQFAAMARTQSRPPIALFSMANNSNGDESVAQRNKNIHRPEKSEIVKSSSHQLSLVSGGPCSLYENDIYKVRKSSSQSQAFAEDDEETATIAHQPSQSAVNFQNYITTRRTVSNFTSTPKHITDAEVTSYETASFLRAAITRGVECALTAPNHKMTEPTTFHQIISPSATSEKLLDIVYEVTLQRLLKQKLSGDEACRSEALRKREKWSNIPAFLVVTVGGMENQTQQMQPINNNSDYYSELPYVAPSNTRQLEDYASTCASIQNLLLSLHAEGLGSKWATGPIIRTLAFREMIGCKPSDMIVGLIFIGWPKRVLRMPRRRRELDDVLKEI